MEKISFLDEFLPKVVCSNANCEVVSKEGSVKGYLTEKELSKAFKLKNIWLMPLSLQNKKIIISAGASGIGWTTAKVCISRGAIVYVCDIDIKSLNKIKKHPLTNKKLFAYQCDASDESEVSNFFDQIKKKTKKIDALINNVGVAGPTGNIEKLNSEDWESTLKINVISHFLFYKIGNTYA